ncbi:MAG: hypothetical protein HOC74_00190 [Gemmatimonadetes bacterium]|jgi:hypothetical protein|nr:hypothetical protein [Gemmatimonadota bacterium]
MLRLLLTSALLGTIALLGAALPPLHAQNVEVPLALEGEDEQLIQGRIDWTDNLLIAYGEGVAPEGMSPAQRRLMGLRAARVAAYRNLLELVGQVQIDAETTVDMAMVVSDTVRTRISGIIQGARVVPGSQQEEGDLYRIALQLKLLDRFADAVLPGQVDETPVSELSTEADSLDSLETPIIFVPPEPYTGLLVDARGLDLQPSMAPRLLGEDGREVYSAAFVERSYATSIGVVGYDKDWERAFTGDRLGGDESHPLVVEALRTEGPYDADLVIDREAVFRVVMADGESNFLSECRVVFLLGPEPIVVDSTLLDSTAIDSIDLETSDLEFLGETGTDSQPQ